MGLAIEGGAENLAEGQIEGSDTLTLSDSAEGRPSGAPAIFVPVILTSSGQNDSFFTSELTLTNRGDQAAMLNYTYTAHVGGESGTASETLTPGRQKIVSNAIDHLRALGIPIPAVGNRIGTLRVAISGSSQVGVTVRTTTPVPGGRAGLAYPGVATGFDEAVYVCGLRQNRQDRSNVAFQNMGTEGEITLRTTVYSGKAGDSSFRVLEDVTLSPGGFHQYSGLLATAGFTQGYVKVERVKGTAPFYAYGVINDQVNSDGSFVFPVTASSLMGIRGQTLPVIVETGVFASELVVTNFSKEAKTVTFRFRAEAIRTPDKTAAAEWTLQPGQQVFVPGIVEAMRQMKSSAIGPPGPTFAGALVATVARGDMSGIAIGARTSSPGGGGHYGVFYNAVPYGAAFHERAWVDALQQNRENRSNLALVNTGEVDGSPSVFQLDVYDGKTGMLANTVTGIRVPAPGWHQINGILDNHAPGATQGYVLIRKTSGNNPFLAYGVVNDGGAPGQRSGDGAYLPAMEAIIDPGTEGKTDREVLEEFYHATGGANWSFRTNWLSNAPLSEWYGVGTDERGRVTSLELWGNQLSGTLPAELGGLSNLNGLNLSENQLRGAVPPELGKLSNLQGLNLSGNKLSGKIPHRLTQLSQLDYLDIRRTAVCVPTNATFQAWLDSITEFRSSGLACDGSLRVRFAASSYQVREGESVELTVHLIDQTEGPARSATLALTVATGDGATDADYSGVPDRVTITAPSTAATFLVTAVEDSHYDHAETIVLGFRRPLPSGVTAAAPDTATVTIIDRGTQETTDREVLTALYHATGGEEWRDRTNWLSDRPISEWYGVGTDGSGQVTRLNLRDNGLSRDIPLVVGQLDRLQQLSLGGNQLVGAIPAELGGLTNLQRLNLEDNHLSGAVPARLGELGNLQELHLSHNQLSGAIPPELGGLSNLQELGLEGNYLTGAIPAELGGLSNLQELDLGGNQLGGAIPTELGGLTNLQRLLLWSNQLSGTIPAELGGLSKLQELILGGNQFGGTIPPELGRLSNLQWLDLGRNQLSGAIPAELGGLSNLRWLDLGGNQLGGAIPTELGGLSNLDRLDLSFNPDLTGTIPAGLQQLPLSTFYLMATAVCVPENAVFRDWSATIEFLPSGAPCGRSLPAMPSIDVAVFFTPAARRLAGGIEEMEAAIDLMIAETNQAYEDSGVNQRISLAAREEVTYEEESGGGSLALDRLTAASDGYMDEVHAIRDRTGADLVHLIADVTDLGGIADLPGVFGLTCAECEAVVFAHELGHNMGLSHDRHVDDAALLPYSHGYVNQQAFVAGALESARWRTIMAYPHQCGDADFNCPWIMRFSNPNQTYLGDPLGVPGQKRTAAVTGPADAARTLNLTRHSAATVRNRTSRNQETISSTLSPSRPVDRIGQVPTPVFSAPSRRMGAGAARRRSGGAIDRATLRRREVGVDIGRLARVPAGGSTALRLNLFDDVVLTGLIERWTPTYSGGYALSGRLAEVPGGTVTLVVNGSVVAGTVRMTGTTYRIRPTGRGSHSIIQIDPSQFSWRCGTELRPQ
ncbi:MAG: leucine-rich repeat domain-containing protein [Acidobacteria bacterium]|nr:leucine-rich repeat domain-containing protein [Acidobacteriota bacterium]